MIICVPTPLTPNRDPDISQIVAATKQIAGHLHKGQLLTLESTTYPGTTQEVILPLLESKGLKVGEDFSWLIHRKGSTRGTSGSRPGIFPKS